MVVNRTWRSLEGRWVVDEVANQSGVEYWLWDEGVLVAEVAGPGELDRLLSSVIDPQVQSPAGDRRPA
jgi:hypothetical protein